MNAPSRRDRVLAYHQGGKVALRLPRPLRTVDDLCLAYTPGVADAVALCRQRFSHIIVVTNQQGIGKGLMSEEDLEAIHRNPESPAVQALEIANEILAFYNKDMCNQ